MTDEFDDLLALPDDPVDAASEVAALRVQDLYRFYDADGGLLYIGISLHAAVRAMQHRSNQFWWLDVARMEVEHLAECTRPQAELIERECIRAERPRHNVAHNSWHTTGEPPSYETIIAARLNVVERGDWRWPTHPPAGLPTISFPVVSLRDATIAVYAASTPALKASMRAQVPIMRDRRHEKGEISEYVAGNHVVFLAELVGGPGLDASPPSDEP